MRLGRPIEIGLRTPSMLEPPGHGPFDPMTDPSQTADPPPMAPDRASAGFVEKTPLERYVPPAKPSLVGLSRVQLAEALGSVGVPAAQGKMRAQQIWHWLYLRGAPRFGEMSSVSNELRTG